jgi:hypothetical protein
MKSRATSRFWKAYDRLPPEIQKSANRAYAVWSDSPYHPSLQFKRVHAEAPMYSVRVGQGYRALRILKEDKIFWFWIGGHDDYMRLLRT